VIDLEIRVFQRYPSIRDIQSFARNARSGSDSGPRITDPSRHHGVSG
jgi:hypothetical protein